MPSTSTLSFFEQEVAKKIVEGSSTITIITPQRNIANPVMSHDDITPLSIPIDYENASEMKDSNISTTVASNT